MIVLLPGNSLSLSQVSFDSVQAADLLHKLVSFALLALLQQIRNGSQQLAVLWIQAVLQLSLLEGLLKKPLHGSAKNFVA
jgi:hypothetical protein